MTAALTAAPPLPTGGAPFSIAQSPFEGLGSAAQQATDHLVLQAAIAAAMQPVGAKRARTEQDPSAADAADPQSPPPRQAGGGKHRPPLPPNFAEANGLALDLQQLQRQLTMQGSSPRGRSPRGAAASPGSRRGGKQMSKMLGRICIECATTSTTQWRSQGLLCNSCGVKLIKGRLPMDAESMHRRFQRLPPAIRDHPMWAAAQVVAQAQMRAVAAAAAGQPWACPGCGRQGCDKVAGPCGLQQCAACAAQYQAPAGAAAVAVTVAAPPGSLTPSPSPPPVGQGAATGSAHKRRKQAAPRVAAGGPSPLSMSSSGSSSIQAYSFQSAREGEEGVDDASSQEPSPHHGRPASRRAAQLRREHGRGGAAGPATATPGGAASLAAQLRAQARVPVDTPTAAEAAAALLVLTESDELRVAVAHQVYAAPGGSPSAAYPAAALAASPVWPDAAAAVSGGAGQGPAGQARVPPVTPAEKDAPATARKAEAGAGDGDDKRAAVRSLDAALQQQQQQQAEQQWGCGAGAATVPSGAATGPGRDTGVQLYQLLIAASGTAEAGTAGLSAELVGRYLAAHTMPAQRLAASGAADAAAAVLAAQAQQEQQARLVALMVQERQYTAAVSLMQGVVKLAGLSG